MLRFSENIAVANLNLSLQFHYRNFCASVSAKMNKNTAKQSQTPRESSKGRKSLLHSSELAYLNAQHDFPLKQKARQKSFPFAGLGRKILVKVRKLLLSDYLRDQQEYQAQLVRFLNRLSKEQDPLHNSSSEQIAQIRDELSGTLHSWEKEKLGKNLALLSSRLDELERSFQRQEQQTKTLNTLVSGLEQILSRIDKKIADGGDWQSTAGEETTTTNSQKSALSSSKGFGYDYLLFEHRFRGSEEEIKKRMAVYPPLFEGAAGPILEIGSGRGELLSLFAEKGIKAYGVEINRAMKEHAKEQGLDARLGDGISHLSRLANSTLGGVIATQVVEHLEDGQLRKFLELCAEKVKTSGLVVLETINTESIVALAQHYFRDPTHVWPLHPDTLSRYAELAGLRVKEVRKLQAFPKEIQLQKLSANDYMTPRWSSSVEVLNDNFSKLNEVLYGFQDYCLIAEVRAPKS